MTPNTEQFNADTFGAPSGDAIPPSSANSSQGTYSATWTAGGIGGGVF